VSVVINGMRARTSRPVGLLNFAAYAMGVWQPKPLGPAMIIYYA